VNIAPWVECGSVLKVECGSVLRAEYELQYLECRYSTWVECGLKYLG
jgi:hypothetical protein